MGLIILKAIGALVFVVVPGFRLGRNLKDHPILTVCALLIGFGATYSLISQVINQEQNVEKRIKFNEKDYKDSGLDTGLYDPIISSAKEYLVPN